ncbi:hypothetical protein [Clostridium sp. JNZ J1-5]|nr:hypothetical protein [Clostridium sp.]
MSYVYMPVILANIIIGISAIIFNKYPSRGRSLEKAKKKYKNVDQKKLAQADGIGYLVIALIWIFASVVHAKKSQSLAELILILSIIIGVAYLWLKDDFLNKNNGGI